MNDYIESIVSHIKNRRAEEAAREELTDHYIEKQRFYEEIGYDEESAGLKTQEDIGDPDMIGEQLNVKPKKTVRIFVLLFLMYIVAGFSVALNTDLFEKYVALESAFFLTIPVALMIILIAAITQKAHVISSLSAFFSLIFLQGYIAPIIAEIIVGADTSFVNYQYGFNMLLFRYDHENDQRIIISEYLKQFSSYQTVFTVLCLAFVCAVGVCGIGSVIIGRRTRRLENTKNDYLLSVVFRKILIAVTVITVAAAAACVVMVARFPNEYLPNSKQSLIAEDEKYLKLIKDNAESPFFEDDVWLKYSKDGTVIAIERWNSDESYSADGSTVSASEHDYDFSLKLEDYQYIDKKPIYTRAEAKNIMEKMKSVTVIDDAPKPYEIKYSSSEKDKLTIIYPCDYYGELRYVFINQNGEFVLNGSIIRTDIDVKPSEEIRAQCEALLKQDFKTDYYKDEFKSYPDSEITFISEEYGVNYDADSDTYEFLYSGFIPVMTTQVEGKRYIVSHEKSEEYDGQKTIVRISPSGGKVRVDEDISEMIKYEPDFSTAPIDYNPSPFYNTSALKIAEYFEENYGIKLYGFIFYFDDDVGFVVNDFN